MFVVKLSRRLPYICVFLFPIDSLNAGQQSQTKGNKRQKVEMSTLFFCWLCSPWMSATTSSRQLFRVFHIKTWKRESFSFSPECIKALYRNIYISFPVIYGQGFLLRFPAAPFSFRNFVLRWILFLARRFRGVESTVFLLDFRNIYNIKYSTLTKRLIVSTLKIFM